MSKKPELQLPRRRRNRRAKVALASGKVPLLKSTWTWDRFVDNLKNAYCFSGYRPA